MSKESNNLLELYLERVLISIKNTVKTLNDAEKYLKILMNNNHCLISPFFQQFESAILDFVNSKLQDLSIEQICSQHPSVIHFLAKIDCAGRYQVKELAGLREKAMALITKVNSLELTID